MLGALAEVRPLPGADCVVQGRMCLEFRVIRSLKLNSSPAWNCPVRAR